MTWDGESRGEPDRDGAAGTDRRQPTMTKKHFEAAAAYVRQLRRAGFTPGDCLTVEDAFADVFSQFNPRFDVERFRAACQTTDEVILTPSGRVRGRS